MLVGFLALDFLGAGAFLGAFFGHFFGAMLSERGFETYRRGLPKPRLKATYNVRMYHSTSLASRNDRRTSHHTTGPMAPLRLPTLCSKVAQRLVNGTEHFEATQVGVPLQKCCHVIGHW